jgi:hypothetical protein
MFGVCERCIRDKRYCYLLPQLVSFGWLPRVSVHTYNLEEPQYFISEILLCRIVKITKLQKYSLHRL